MWTLCHIPRTAGTSLKRTHPTVVHQHDPHATAHQLRRYCGVAGPIFAVLRDPIDRAVSLYHVQHSEVATPARFLTWLEGCLKGKNDLHGLPNGLPWWAPAARYVTEPKTGELVVDKLLRFEDVIAGRAMEALSLPVGALAGRDKALSPVQIDEKRLYSDWPGVREACEELYAEDFTLRARL